MYTNIGGKIKGLACVSGWIFLIAGVITWFVFIVNDSPYDDFIGWLCLPGGAMGYLGTWALYGFGQLVEDTNALRRHACGAMLPKAVESDELPNL